MRIRASLACSFICVPFFLGGCAQSIADTSSPQFIAAATPVGDYSLNIKSMSERKFSGIIRQKYDFSCGSAALAGLLRYHYNFKVSEEDAFRGMWSKGDREQIRRVGFSLLDMKRWLSVHGLTANGYKVPLDKIAKTGVPGIALISVKNYRHFVVVKGIRGKEVLLGDPSSGLTVMSLSEFESAWNGVYFVLSGEQELAKSQFNRIDQWNAYARAPGASGFSNPASEQALSLTAPFYGDF